jgi:cob(I)alamin adenosyltransferase
MVYTKTGDKGTTSLVGGTRVQKCDDRVEAYGTVDELNSYIGLVAEMAQPISEKYYAELKRIQNELFTVQTLLATEDPQWLAKLPQLPADAVLKLEHSIDEMTAELPQNKAFIIAGGSLVSAQTHVARTVCRRAERCCVRLNLSQPIDEQLLKYINRLSDYLFVLSRMFLKLENKSEHYWQSPEK